MTHLYWDITKFSANTLITPWSLQPITNNLVSELFLLQSFPEHELSVTIYFWILDFQIIIKTWSILFLRSNACQEIMLWYQKYYFFSRNTYDFKGWLCGFLCPCIFIAVLIHALLSITFIDNMIYGNNIFVVYCKS